VEGNKKRKGFTGDYQAVSEVMGAVLMIAIVVLAFSSVALTVYSDGESMDPPHTPHTNLQESISRSKDIIQIFHSGGEPIDLKYIEIVLNVDGKQVEFNMSDPNVEVYDPEGNLSSDPVFKLRDCIKINTSSKVDISESHAIDLYFVHTESSQVIQKTMLWRDFGDLPEWITPYPYGSVYESWTAKYLDSELLDKEGDGLYTNNEFPQKTFIYENFTFGSLDDLGIPEDTTFTKVILKIVYRIHDESAKLIMQVNNGSPAWEIELPKKGNESLNNSDFVEMEQDITPYIKNATDLENLVINISTTPNAAYQADKQGWIDFIGIHLEY
jgi:FlaG/FlaF family flagellin (archaellin)